MGYCADIERAERQQRCVCECARACELHLHLVTITPASSRSEWLVGLFQYDIDQISILNKTDNGTVLARQNKTVDSAPALLSDTSRSLCSQHSRCDRFNKNYLEDSNKHYSDGVSKTILTLLLALHVPFCERLVPMVVIVSILSDV